MVTEERWYPGTLILTTLQRTEGGEEVANRSIQMLSRALRWGYDGVGLQYILAGSKEAHVSNTPLIKLIEGKESEKFLKQLKTGK